jgi:predicted Ser/Thr protein kinase
MEQCLAEDVAHALATGQLVGPDAKSAHAHVDSCEKCRRWISELARAEAPSVPSAPSATPSTWAPGATTAGGSSPAQPDASLELGRVLGSYEVRRHVGSGGMSFVYAAFDQHLGRNVALKLLKPKLATPQMKARLLREAQAMARLAHPNVLPIYEARDIDGTLCIAMELVEGATLGRWLQGQVRPWREVLRVFREAAQGLAAAHAAGIVHRDFKPDNVLIGNDGRVRVSDFGLARWSSDAPAGDAAITQSGTFVGTPVYMSPEQALGGDVDARSDQFSFCVALYEGFAGRRPFSGANLDELSRAMRERAFEPPARGRSVPRWVRPILHKGLSPEREGRFASMQALLDALAEGERRSDRRRMLLRAGVGLATAVAAFVAWQRWPHAEPPLPTRPPVVAAPVVVPQPAPVVEKAPEPEPAPQPVVAKPPPPAPPPRAQPKKGLAVDSQSPY